MFPFCITYICINLPCGLLINFILHCIYCLIKQVYQHILLLLVLTAGISVFALRQFSHALLHELQEVGNRWTALISYSGKHFHELFAIECITFGVLEPLPVSKNSDCSIYWRESPQTSNTNRSRTDSWWIQTMKHFTGQRASSLPKAQIFAFVMPSPEGKNAYIYKDRL